MPERQLAFVVLDLGEISYGASAGVVADFLEHMEGFDAAAVEAFAVLPDSQRHLLSAAIDAAASTATHGTQNRNDDG
jgi:hypothetical protein